MRALSPQLSAVVFTFLVVACQQKSAEEKLIKDVVAPAASWAASLQFTAEKWLANSAPEAFVRASADAGAKEFDKAKKSVAESKADPKLRSAIAAQLDVSRDAAGDLQAAVKRGDRRAAAQAMSRFASAHQALEQISQ